MVLRGVRSTGAALNLLRTLGYDTAAARPYDLADLGLSGVGTRLRSHQTRGHGVLIAEADGLPRSLKTIGRRLLDRFHDQPLLILGVDGTGAWESFVMDSIVALAQRLVRIPSRGGEDDPGPILETLKTWLEENSVATELPQASDGFPVALVGEIRGARPGPTYCLDAWIDTAPFGDPSTWRRPPTTGNVEHGYLHGRGAADSKMGAAVFAHVAADVAAGAGQLAGNLLVLFDADEHTGRFGGARAFLEHHPDVAGVIIGYPGRGAVGVGAGGFFRATLHVGGVAAHSGSSTQRGTNATEKASLLVELMRGAKLPKAAGTFPHPPSLTVTAIAGGEGFSTVPDLCSVKVDLRLTPSFDEDSARELLRTCAERVDSKIPTPAATRLEEHETWPAYRLAEDEPIARALLTSAREQLAGRVEARVAGPSNIGNLCAAHGVPATCGFGVEAVNVHAANEAAGIDDIEAIFSAYRAAVGTLLGG